VKPLLLEYLSLPWAFSASPTTFNSTQSRTFLCGSLDRDNSEWMSPADRAVTRYGCALKRSDASTVVASNAQGRSRRGADGYSGGDRVRHRRIGGLRFSSGFGCGTSSGNSRGGGSLMSGPGFGSGVGIGGGTGSIGSGFRGSGCMAFSLAVGNRSRLISFHFHILRRGARPLMELS